MREGDLLWEPRGPSKLSAFIEERGFSDYHELWRWSVEDLEGFWGAIWERYEVGPPPARVLGDDRMPGAEWFPGTRLNYAEQLFRRARPGATAILHATESSPLAEMSWDELREQTARCAAGLRGLGVERGDRVAAYMPNVPETVVAFLACASIGAVWSSCAPEFGVPTVVDRFKQIEPRVLLATEGYRYGGKDFDRRDRVREIEAAIPSLEHTVLVPSGWDELLSEPAELEFEQLPFDHPLWVLYSSGTTGLPKAIVQGQGGILLEHLKKANLHSDLSERDRFFWFTTTGWMMWNFLVGGLLSGAAIVLYDGQPDPEGLWKLAAEADVTSFGTSAGFITACMKAGIEPARPPGLRAIGSTGSPLPVEGFEWVYRHFPEAWLFSTSGGTDLCTAFVGAVPCLPVYAGELQARCLGASVEAWSEAGEPLVDQVGELVITRPMPSMPLYFWNDPGRRALPPELLRDVPGHLAPRRLDQDHDPRQRRDLWPLGLDDQPRRRAHGHERDLQRRRGDARGARLTGRRRRRADAPVRGAARGCRARRRAARDDSPARARVLLAQARAGLDRADCRGAAHALEQEARGPGEEDPARGRSRQCGEP